MSEQKNAIELRGICKYFGEVRANDGIDLTVRKGEILALLGENGSGKTTLMNMLSGIYKPDAGNIIVNGEEVAISSPEISKHLGIGMVHQHFKLVERFTAADNIWMAAKDERSFFLPRGRCGKIKEFADSYGFEIDPGKRVADMTVSEKQTVEILKLLYNGADILILDEPTAVLTLQETRNLFSILRRMADSGCAVIVITHKLNEVMELSDRVSILRKGKSIATVNTAETNMLELTEMMVGHKVSLEIDRPKCVKDEALLSLRDISILDEDDSLIIDGVSFDVHAGEILGIAGVSGCGQKELCEAVAGLYPLKSGEILYKGEHIEGLSPKQIISRGISMSFVPEDRLGMGLAASLNITDNVMLKNYADSKSPFVNRKYAKEKAKNVVERLDIDTPSIDTPVSRLSGGNVQKVLLGREIEASPQVLVTAYPVRGLDINSSYTIYDILNEQKKRGVAILYIGEDLDVMLELCDRILVLCHGKVTGLVDAAQTSKEELGLMMTDAHSGLDYIRESSRSSSESPGAKRGESSRSKKKYRQPLLRVIKRDHTPLWKQALLYLGAIILAFGIGAVFIAVNGTNPLTYYKTMIESCFQGFITIRAYIFLVIPLIITSLGVAVAFRMKFWNVGANGQFVVGAIMGATVAIALGDSLPRWLVLILMAVAGAVGGGLFGLIPAFFKVKFGASETLLTLMFNYIAYYFLTYLKKVMFYRKVSETGQVFRPDFKAIPENGWLYEFKIGDIKVDIALVVALALVAVVFIYFRYTKQGYEISVVGDSRATARYAGMNVNKIMLRTMFFSAAIVGLAGMLKLSGASTLHTLGDGISADVGWTGIIVAWLAKLNPPAILVVSLLMGVLEKGAEMAQNAMGLSSALSNILQGIILFTVLGFDFFIRYRVETRKAVRSK